ncbi:hypothetical protein TNCT_584361 [Trichonephila clavata]|uniref:Uncharacterized protein n=1 Tax=Trichonephila clavata TaxID=2740835 RepID=A0A8X6LSQ3_TRICU|nr:hypothetical protein TNCT_584361 [Trichonephila clavata]
MSCESLESGSLNCYCEKLLCGDNQSIPRLEYCFESKRFLIVMISFHLNCIQRKKILARMCRKITQTSHDMKACLSERKKCKRCRLVCPKPNNEVKAVARLPSRFDVEA